MMHGMEKSDSVIVAEKSANKGTPVPAESMEPRAEPKGNPGRPKHAPGAGTGEACHKRPTGYGNSYNGSHGSV